MTTARRVEGMEGAESTASTGCAEQIVCGFHAVEAWLAREPAAVVEVVVDRRRRDGRGARLQREVARAGVAVRLAVRAELDELARAVKHQGVVARVRRAAPGGPDPSAQTGQAGLNRLLDGLDGPPLLLILDRIQDPHNLGACLRTADGAGADAVVLPKGGACPVTPAVTRVAAGAAGRLPVFRVSNLARTMENLQQRGIWITGGDAAAGRTLYEVDLGAAAAIVVGAEGCGLRRLTRQHCDQLARIPLAGSVSSLNVSVAAGVFLFEALRQRRR